MRQIESFHAPAPYGDPDLSRRLLPYVPNEHLRRDPVETSQLHDYLMILRHRWKLIAGFTVAGLVMKQLGRLPRRGETLQLGDCEIKVMRFDRRRIDSLRLTAPRDIVPPEDRPLEKE